MRGARFTAVLAALCAVLVCAGSALALTGRAQYTGKTSESSTVRLRLSSDGKRIAKMRIYYNVNCDNGTSGVTYTDVVNLRLNKRHRFAGQGSYTGQRDGSKNTFKVSGAVSARKAAGAFSLTATVPNTSTGAVTHCSTGALTFTALRVG